MTRRAPGTRLMLAGLAILAGLSICAVLATSLAPHDPQLVDLERVLRPPSASFPLGTDALGRCVLSRVVVGARTSLGGATAASLLAMVLGAAVATIGAALGPRADRVIRGALDVGLAFPGFALALAVVGAMGPGSGSLLVALGLAGAPWWGRFIHDAIRAASARPYVSAARVAGVGPLRLMVRHVVPEVAPLVLVALAWRSGGVLASLAGLSYLGLGVQPPAAEWGAMLREAREYLGHGLWLTVAPGAAVSAAIAGFVMAAEGLRDRLQVRDPMEW